MKCPKCSGSGKVKEDISSLCPECEGLGGFELTTIAECYPDACALPGADTSIERCYTCRQVSLRPLTEHEEREFKLMANQIGSPVDEWIVDKINKREAKIYGKPIRLRPKKYEDNADGMQSLVSMLKKKCDIFASKAVCSKCTLGVNHSLTCAILRQVEKEFYSKGDKVS